MYRVRTFNYIPSYIACHFPAFIKFLLNSLKAIRASVQKFDLILHAMNSQVIEQIQSVWTDSISLFVYLSIYVSIICLLI